MSVLEPAAREFARAAAQAPPLDQLGPVAARKALEEIQAGPTTKPDVDSAWGTAEESALLRAAMHARWRRADSSSVPWTTVGAGGISVGARIVRPWDSVDELLPVVLYLHGGGWVLGSASTHDRLVRELAVGVRAAIVFVAFDRSPEARYPVALHQAHAVACWIRDHGATALVILAQRRGDVSFVQQSLYYPVTDAAQDSDSYRQFALGPHLTAESMAWFWDAYLPDPAARTLATASPLRASLQDLAGLPEAFIIVDECDVLRDEGEAYAARLIQAGVRCSSVRYNSTLHDFMMLDPLRETGAATAALAQAIDVLRRALSPSLRYASGHAREG